MERKPIRLYRTAWNIDDVEQFALVAAYQEQEVIHRVNQLLGINPAHMREPREVNTGASQLLLSTSVIDQILEIGCSGYKRFMEGQDSVNQHLHESNQEAISRLKYKLK